MKIKNIHNVSETSVPFHPWDSCAFWSPRHWYCDVLPATTSYYMCNLAESRPVRNPPKRGAAGEQPLHLGTELLVQELENGSEVWSKFKLLTWKMPEPRSIFMLKKLNILLSIPPFAEPGLLRKTHVEGVNPNVQLWTFPLPAICACFSKWMDVLLNISNTNQKTIPHHTQKKLSFKNFDGQIQNFQCTDNLYTQLLI